MGRIKKTKLIIQIDLDEIPGQTGDIDAKYFEVLYLKYTLA
jgi:hypothetical protein